MSTTQFIEGKVFSRGQGLSTLDQPPIGTRTNVEVHNCRFSGMEGECVDGATLGGYGTNIKNLRSYWIENCSFTQKGLSPTQCDELASLIYGARAVFYRCRFSFNGKGVLVGSGDTDAYDLFATHVLFHQCIFEGCSRRNPFIQVGQGVVSECLIKNWGIDDTFHVKSFGIRAGSKAQVIVRNCVFEQESLFSCASRKNAFSDMTNHYLFPIFAGPGFRRAAYADLGGSIKCYHCYKNRPWLYVQNHCGPWMSEVEAQSLSVYLDRVVPREQTKEKKS